MDEGDRLLIFQTINEKMKNKSPIVVLHGTDTMEISAEFCYNHIPNPSVAVVFTGAMIPMGFEDTDAIQNVTEAILASKLLVPGFYISFHNQIFKVPNVKKNKEKKTFESK
jgi:L-asparaginase